MEDPSGSASSHIAVRPTQPFGLPPRPEANDGERVDRPKQLRDKAVQHEFKVFSVAEQQHLVQLARQGLQGRVKALEEELEAVKQERDALLAKATAAESYFAPLEARRSPAPEESVAESGTIRWFPFDVPNRALTALKSMIPTLKRIIAPLPRRPPTVITDDPPPRAARIAPPIPSTIPPARRLNPSFSLLDTPASEKTNTAPDLIRKLAVLRVSTADTGASVQRVLQRLLKARSDPFPRPLAINSNDSCDIFVGLRSDKDVATTIRLLKRCTDPPFLAFEYRHDQRGSRQFAWQDLSDEVRETWDKDRKLPEPVPTRALNVSSTANDEIAKPRNGVREPTKNKKRKKRAVGPDLVDRVHPRPPVQHETVTRMMPPNYPTMNFAATPMPSSILPGFAPSATLPLRSAASIELATQPETSPQTALGRRSRSPESAPPVDAKRLRIEQ